MITFLIKKYVKLIKRRLIVSNSNLDFCSACRAGDVSKVQALIAAGAKVDADKYGDTPLSTAIQRGHGV